MNGFNREKARAAALASRVNTVLDGLSSDIFSLDLSDPASHPAAEAFLAGRLSVLRGLGVDVSGWAR